MQCKSRTMSNMMFKQKWSCNLFEMFLWCQFNPLLWIAWKEECKPPHLGEGAFARTSSGLKGVVDQQISHLSPLIKMGDDLTYDRCNKCPIPHIGHQCNELNDNDTNAPIKIERKTCWHSKKAYGQCKEPRSMSLPKTYMKVVLKEVS